MNVESVLQDIAAKLKSETADVKAFIDGAFSYARDNIKPEVIKVTADVVAAAESAFAQDATVDKVEFAFSNAVAAFAKDGIEFIEADYNFAVETVMQARNAALAAAARPTSDAGTAQDQVS